MAEMIMDRHVYGQHLSQEPDISQIGLHPRVEVEEEEEDDDRSLHCRQVRVLNLIDLLFGDNFNDYNSDHGHGYGYNHLSHGNGGSTPPWQQRQKGRDTSFGNGHISPGLTLSSLPSPSSLLSSCSPSISSVDNNQLDYLRRRNASSAANNTTTTMNSTNNIPSDTHVAVKQGPSRPLKGSFSSFLKRPPSPHPPEITVAPKGGRGRPRKQPLGPPLPLSSRPLPTSADVAAKRGPGRPRKHPFPPPIPIPTPHPLPPDTVVPVPAKRGPGRPPKVFSSSSSSSSRKLPLSPDPPNPPKTNTGTVTLRHGPRPTYVLPTFQDSIHPNQQDIHYLDPCQSPNQRRPEHYPSSRTIARKPSQSIDAADAASIPTLCPVPVVVMVPKRRDPGRPKGSRNHRRGQY